MSLRFFRRIRIAPGVRFNISGSGISTSFGGKGMWYTIGTRGRRQVTFGIPGTGVRYTSSLPTVPSVKVHRSGWLLLVLVIAIAAYVVITQNLL